MDAMAVSLLVVGRDGNGKSSTCNSILNLKYFTPSSTNFSAEFDCRIANLTVKGRDVTLTKISGLDYPNTDVTGSVEDYFKKIEKEVKASSNGFSAVIIVLRYGQRYTKQEQDYIMMIKSTFGSDVVKNYGVIVLTNGDNFAADNEPDGQSFENWCHAQTGDFRALFNECDGRCVLFNNWTKEDETLNRQRENLFSVVANIPLKMSPYTLTDYEKAADSRTVILVTCALPRLKEDTINLLTDIGTQMRQLQQNEPETKEKLTELQEKLDTHRRHLEKEDKNTHLLSSLFLEMSLVEKSVAIKLQIAEQMNELEGFTFVECPDIPNQNPPGQDNSEDNSNATSADPSGTGAHCSGNSSSGGVCIGDTNERGVNMGRPMAVLGTMWHYLKRFYNNLPWLSNNPQHGGLKNQSSLDSKPV